MSLEILSILLYNRFWKKYKFNYIKAQIITDNVDRSNYLLLCVSICCYAQGDINERKQ